MARIDTTESEFIEELVSIRRVSKTVKGGKNFSFSALMVVGDGKGRIGYGSGSAREVPEAIQKAVQQARRNLVRIPLREGRTLHHDVEYKCGASRIMLRSAAIGTGIIAGGALRAVFSALGIKDVVAKSYGTNSANTLVKATFEALGQIASPRSVAAKRGKKVSEIVGRRRVMEGTPSAAAE
jgi:small subunit ribosomal protein S5